MSKALDEKVFLIPTPLGGTCSGVAQRPTCMWQRQKQDKVKHWSPPGGMRTGVGTQLVGGTEAKLLLCR